MFFLLLLCSSGLAGCLPRGARWTEGNITLRCYQSIKCYLKYNWAPCNCWFPCLITIVIFSIEPNMSTFFLNFKIYLQNYVLFIFHPNILTQKAWFYCKIIPNQIKFRIFCFFFISYTMHCATNCCTYTLWGIWHFGRKSVKYRVVSVVLSLKIY